MSDVPYLLQRGRTSDGEVTLWGKTHYVAYLVHSDGSAVSLCGQLATSLRDGHGRYNPNTMIVASVAVATCKACRKAGWKYPERVAKGPRQPPRSAMSVNAPMLW